MVFASCGSGIPAVLCLLRPFGAFAVYLLSFELLGDFAFCIFGSGLLVAFVSTKFGILSAVTSCGFGLPVVFHL